MDNGTNIMVRLGFFLVYRFVFTKCRCIHINKNEKKTRGLLYIVCLLTVFYLGVSLTYLSVGLWFHSGVSNRIHDYFMQVQFNEKKMEWMSHSARVMDVVQAF